MHQCCVWLIDLVTPSRHKFPEIQRWMNNDDQVSTDGPGMVNAWSEGQKASITAEQSFTIKCP